MVNDKQEGKWSYWSDNGKKVTEKTYQAGNLIKEETKSIENLVSNFHSTNDSYLFKTRETDKVFIRFDFNLKKRNNNIEKVIAVIKSNLNSSTRLKHISNDGNDKDEIINYIIECTDINISEETMSCKDSKGVPHTAYISTISASFVIKNIEGRYIDSHAYTGTNRGLFLTTCIYSHEEAFSRANTTNYIDKFIETQLPIKTFITGVIEKNKDGTAKSVSVEGGTNIGMFSCEFNVLDEQNSLIGKIKVKDINSNTTICKVKNGEEIITSKLASGAKLKVISTN